MNKEILKNLIDLVDDNNTDAIFRMLIRFMPEDKPLPDEIQAIAVANQEINDNELISHDEINWDE